ncbi:MAG TPA: ATPase, T2SS/T4P/T4SS family [Terriglobales bacterium]|nr:ATPase, T2SS/T4P/T4SS family [Terriglobales bacterium]
MDSRLGQLLVQRGLVTQAQLAGVTASQTASTCLAATLVRCGIIAEDTLAALLASELKRPRLDLDAAVISANVAALVPESCARRHHLFAVDLHGNRLTVAMADPSDLNAVNELRLLTGYDVRPVVATVGAIDRAMANCHRAAAPEERSPASRDAGQERATAEDGPVVRLVDSLLARAVERGASDLHFEPYEDVFRVRYRIDGLLQEAMRPPLTLRNAAISRLKVMASLNIAEHRLPQDGRFRLARPSAAPIDFRISVLPTLHGEKVVLRVLDHSRIALDLSCLGLGEREHGLLRQCLRQPHGLILVTGPTGSGKSTTLYAALAALNDIGRNVCTVEDPVELHLAGVNQVAVNDDVGLTFATALRALLRQDPDVIMVGEIRDSETATIAVRAAMTGHLVLSTLHANDTATAITRLLDMGVPAYLIASAANLVIAQRLLRRRCDACQAATGAEEIRRCARCGGCGYFGRAPIFEVMPVDAALRTGIQQGVAADELRQRAIAAGLQTLTAAATAAVASGWTDAAEVTRALDLADFGS